MRRREGNGDLRRNSSAFILYLLFVWFKSIRNTAPNLRVMALAVVRSESVVQGPVVASELWRSFPLLLAWKLPPRICVWDTSAFGKYVCAFYRAV